MGITGLLPTLNSITTDGHISDLSNCKVAVDISCWLHKGAYGCSTELCQGIPTDKYFSFWFIWRYVIYCLQRLKLLLNFNITPIVIFDGGTLPMKKQTNATRKQYFSPFNSTLPRIRVENREKALSYLKEGDVYAARDCFQKAVEITGEMIFEVIKVNILSIFEIEMLRREKVQYIVAPYEADAQMAYLSLNNFVDCVITEDSDLLAYGCPRVESFQV